MVNGLLFSQVFISWVLVFMYFVNSILVIVYVINVQSRVMFFFSFGFLFSFDLLQGKLIPLLWECKYLVLFANTNLQRLQLMYSY